MFFSVSRKSAVLPVLPVPPVLLVLPSPTSSTSSTSSAGSTGSASPAGECQRRIRVFSVTQKAGLPRNETTRHPWLIACDANKCPQYFEKSLKFQREEMHVVAPKEASTCRSKGPKGEWIERTYDYVSASGSLKGKISQTEVVEDFESRPHEADSTGNGMSRSCRRCFRVTAEEGYQEEVPKRDVEKQRRKMRAAERERERKVRYKTAQEVVAGIKEKGGVRKYGKKMGSRCEVGGDFGAKKDGTILFAVGSHAKGT